MAKIWENDLWYSVLRPYVDWCTRASFSSLEVKGRENIPTDGAVILAPNHCNTLMDALLVLQADRGPSSYGARADIFRKNSAARILRWLKIVPLARQRDGREALERNEDVFDEVVDVLEHDVPFCMFSEGTHRTKHSLQPLKKGVWRLATRTARKIDKPVYIVPVGLEYDDYFRYMKHARVSFGEPIRVYADTPQEEVLPVLYQRISSLITFFPDDENYEDSVRKWQESHKRQYNCLQQAGRILLAILSLPFFLVFAILCCPMWITAWILDSKLKDKAWLNTMRFATKLVLMPIVALAVGIPAFIFLPWYWAIVVLLMVAVSHSAFYYLQNYYRSLVLSLKQ